MQATASKELDSKRRAAVAVFGGVFDPVHNAHIAVARCALRTLPVGRVVFLPAGIPPHKPVGPGATATQRLRMLELALVELHGACTIDERELRRSGKSYTVLTLRELRAEHPDQEIYFLIGSDNIAHIANWYCAEEVLSLCTPIVFPRASAPARFEKQHLPWLTDARRAELNRLVLDAAELAISSSEVRRRAAGGESIAGMVPTPVAAFIDAHKLYR